MNANADGDTPTLSQITTHNHVQRPWWHELLLVDFRHAFWPWAAYLIACLMFATIPPSGNEESGSGLLLRWIGTIIIIVFAVPAIIAQIYSTDFSHHTSQSLLTFPRQRKTIWFTRTGLLLALLLIPMAAAVAAFTVQMVNIRASRDVPFVFTAFVLQTIYCQVTFGALLAVLLPKKLVAWSAMVVSPLVLIMVAQILRLILGIEGSDKITTTFPYLPAFLFWFIIISGIPAIILAYRQWLRLEVRS